MLQQINENSILPIIFILGLFAIIVVLYFINRKLRGGANSSDHAWILKCSFRPLGGFSGMGIFTRMSDNMTSPVGTLIMTIGRPISKEIPKSVDVNLLIIDENKNVFQASKQLSVVENGIIGVINVPFPIKPYEKEFICKAWITAAYYEYSDTWVNKNASKYEKMHKNYIQRKLNKIK